MTHFARRRKRAEVVAIVPDPSATAQRAVDRLRDADCESLYAATERDRRIGFEEQVDVVALNAEVKEPESFVR